MVDKAKSACNLTTANNPDIASSPGGPTSARPINADTHDGCGPCDRASIRGLWLVPFLLRPCHQISSLN